MCFSSSTNTSSSVVLKFILCLQVTLCYMQTLHGEKNTVTHTKPSFKSYCLYQVCTWCHVSFGLLFPLNLGYIITKMDMIKHFDALNSEKHQAFQYLMYSTKVEVKITE